ncbi:dehydrogenase [Massilia sp. DJPM01]|uniref:GHMP family kinase ATP-binding protein n=1 Tax=Massilia sp. DJPM01 TaxID=3024404 RepID=UPI00259E8072|nr:dehydrogenase [Massilia sp. DJPM01]MDM5175752.1 dehydrogenase [Massilia sp. DJPM01]
MSRSAIVRARAPLRLGLAGGGTDVSPYCDIYGGQVVNATIALYAHAELAPAGDHACLLRSLDQGCSMQLGGPEPVQAVPALVLHQAVYREMIARYHGGKPLALSLSTRSDAPAGSGLGSSSTMVVAMIHAFSVYLALDLGAHEIAQLAFHIERVVCGLQGGRQDQFAAACGGFNFMSFPPGGAARIAPLDVPAPLTRELAASLVLCYTGMSRASARIISDQSENIRQGASAALEATHALKLEATSMRDCLLAGDMQGIVASMHTGWENKKKLARSVSNPHIDAMYAAALRAGALAGKVSGAGGGGFMMFLAPPGRRAMVGRVLAEMGGQVSRCRFDEAGSTAWRVGAGVADSALLAAPA